MKVKEFNIDDDYEILVDWWLKHGSNSPKKSHLSSTGLIIKINSIPICIGFLYNTDSKISFFEQVIVNPSVDKKLRDLALPMLIKKIKEIAKERGYELLCSSISIPRYIKRLKDEGFIEVDKHQTHLFCEL